MWKILGTRWASTRLACAEAFRFLVQAGFSPRPSPKGRRLDDARRPGRDDGEEVAGAARLPRGVRVQLRGAVGALAAAFVTSGGTKRATSANMPPLRLQSSEGKFTMSREIEPVRRSFRRSGSCTLTEVERLVPSG